MFTENFDFTLDMTVTEAELIFALLSHIRLGRPDEYTQAAHSLLDRMVNVVGDDFGNMVDVGATIENENGDINVSIEIGVSDPVPW